jgi:hypothetical protein
MYLYETHLHTSPVSKCAGATVRENIEYYKSIGYAGIFITNHFIDGNISVDRTASYEERIEYYFSDYEEGVRIGRELNFPVFCGIEMSYGGTDFLVYGLDKAWFLSHPEINEMQQTDKLALLASEGALIVQAHPFREASYINHIRLFPRHVHGVEIYNACRTEFENALARQYAENYGLLAFAGSDNHSGAAQAVFGGMATEVPVESVDHFIRLVRSGEAKLFMRRQGDISLL